MEGADALRSLLAAGSALASSFGILPLITRGPGRPPIKNTAEDVLQSERRRAVYDAILAAPGLPVTELRRSLGIGSGTLYNHLDRLTAAGLIELHELAGHKRAYPAGKVPTPEKAPLESANVRHVARMILIQPGLSAVEIAEEMGVSKRMALKYLKPLLDAGLIRAQKEGVRQAYAPTSRLRAALNESKP